MPERPSHHDSTPEQPSVLPPELAEFLKDQQYAALLHATDQGTVMVVKAPRRDIRSVRGQVPIELRHELYAHPAAPVVRVVTRIYDQPDRPLALETYVNVEDLEQRADYAALAQQDHLLMLFYDERLRHQLTKRVGVPNSETVAEVVSNADRLLAAVPAPQRDFNLAKADVMARTSL